MQPKKRKYTFFTNTDEVFSTITDCTIYAIAYLRFTYYATTKLLDHITQLLTSEQRWGCLYGCMAMGDLGKQKVRTFEAVQTGLATQSLPFLHAWKHVSGQQV